MVFFNAFGLEHCSGLNTRFLAPLASHPRLARRVCWLECHVKNHASRCARGELSTQHLLGVLRWRGQHRVPPRSFPFVIVQKP
eukprot:6173208-Pleurochrysis_carterae.AAC.3